MRRQLQVGSPELQSRLLLYCDGSVNMDSWGVCCTKGMACVEVRRGSLLDARNRKWCEQMHES